MTVLNWEKLKGFWIEEAEEALNVSEHLFDKGDFSYSLFFGHLAVEKLLKALYVTRKKEQAPYIHQLKRLAEIAEVSLTSEQADELLRISAFNLESRYPDENRTFRKKCTPEFTKAELLKIRKMYQWLKSML